jgi:pyruvate kinase
VCDILQTTDAFLLGAETVRGMFPVETLTCVLAICAEAEKGTYARQLAAAPSQADDARCSVSPRQVLRSHDGGPWRAGHERA